MQQSIRLHRWILQTVKHFQEHDKRKTHKLTLDVHLAHYIYIFSYLKTVQTVTYAFKTPLPLPHPPKSLSSYLLGKTSLILHVTVL